MYSIAFINNEETPGTMRGNMVEDERGRDRKGHSLYGFIYKTFQKKQIIGRERRQSFRFQGRSMGREG